jgi:predicted nucleic-acid-binding Zn-ribbon protein
LSIFRPLSDPAEPNPYQVAGVNVICPHCQNQQFFESRIQYNVQEPAYAEDEYTNKMATALACSRCSLMLFFTNKPNRILE